MFLQIPKGNYVSNECKDLLLSLLKHDPNARITFDEFFAHDFLDLEHAPTSENFQKAAELAQRAVKLDMEKKIQEAFHIYCESLRYFIPLLTSNNFKKIYDCNLMN